MRDEKTYRKTYTVTTHDCLFVALTFEFMTPRPPGVFEVDGLLLDSILVPHGAVRLNNQALVDLATKTNT